MAFDPLIEKADEPTPEPAAPAPDPLEGVNAQLAEMRAQINAAYQANKGIQSQPQVQYVPYPIQQQEEPNLSEADILADLPGAIQREAERIAAEREEKLREELGGHLSALYEKDFAGDYERISQRPEFKYVEKELKEHFDSNPAEKLKPGSLQSKYNELVGAKLSEIREAERAAAEANEPARVRSVDHSIPVSSSAPAPTKTAEPVKLSEAEEAALARWNRSMRLNMTPEEWKGIRDGELLPMDYDDDLMGA